MSLVDLFTWSFGIAVGPVMSPGPVSAAVVTEGARQGLRVGPLVSTGHALMELLMVGLLALGMGRALQHPLLAATVGVVGGLFLAWLGGSMVWQTARRRPSLPRPGEQDGFGAGRSLIGVGIATTMSNPLWYVWWIGAGGACVLAAWQQGPLALAAFYLGHISADYAWNTLLASAVGSGRRWLSDGLYQALLVVCGLFLLYEGIRFIWIGVGVA